MARLQVLTALDTAKTQYFHFKAIVIAGMGLFTDAYDLFCIFPIMKLIGRIYYEQGVTPPHVVSAMVAIALLGTVFGQLVFGWLGDRLGRRRVYGLALLLMVSSSVGCGFSVCRTRKCVLTSLCFFRFWLGVGIGGDYPLSATIMSEFANKRTRGSFIAAVFSMQGFGILVSSAVIMAVAAAFDRASPPKSTTGTPPDEADLAWRLILMFGAVPAGLTYYWRMMMPETARYTALVQLNVQQAVQDMQKVLDMPLEPIIEEPEETDAPERPSYGLFSRGFLRHHGRDLFACAASWFIVDIVFYSSNLFQSQIYKARIPDPSSLNAYQEALAVAKLQGIIAVFTTIPGYWAAVIFIERQGRRRIQMLGFVAMAVCMLAIAIPYDAYWERNPNAGFFALYGLTFFFANMGPNTTTFIVPAELFPARFRCFCHGLSGAAGKVGAIVGSVGFVWASQSNHEKEVKDPYKKGIGMKNSLVILGGVCVLGAVVTYLYTTETKCRSLEESEEGDGGVGESRKKTELSRRLTASMA
ncbi:phosphate ion transport [Asimina triloba]